MPVEKFILGNKIMDIQFYLDCSPSMNNMNPNTGKKRIDMLNEAVKQILSVIAGNASFRARIKVAFSFFDGESECYFEFSDASCSAIQNSKPASVRDENGKTIWYNHPEFQTVSNWYGPTNIYGRVVSVIEHLSRQKDGLRYPSILIVISDGDQNDDNDDGSECKKGLSYYCEGNGSVDTMIIPLCVDVGSNRNRSCLKGLSNVFQRGYILYEKTSSFTSVFRSVFASVCASENMQGSRKTLMENIAKKMPKV